MSEHGKDIVMPWATALEWLKLPQRILWGLVLVVASMLWGPSWYIDGLGLQDFIDDYRKYLGVAFLAFLAPTASAMVASFYSAAQTKWSVRGALKLRRQRLHDLSPGEKAVLENYLRANTRSQTLDMADGVTRGLEAAQVIARASSVSRALSYFDYNIQPWAWNYLRDHPELLD